MSSRYDVAVVGGGIFGCSVAKHLAERSEMDICLIEKEYRLANHQSGRNSGTLHPGLALDLEPGTRKAEFAIEGGKRLREYCDEHGLQIYNCGLLLVATNEAEVRRLGEVETRVKKLGLPVDRYKDPSLIHELEPNVEGREALFTPASSTVNTQEITYQLAQEAWGNGVTLRMGYEVKNIDRTTDGIRISTDKGTLEADYLVNAGGVWAPRLARMLDVGARYHMVPFRGQYYELTSDASDLIKTNVYPTSMPPRVPNSVGVHFTRRPDGKVIVGPTGMIAVGPDTYGSTDINLREIARTLSSGNFWKFVGSTDTMKIAWEELNKTYRKETFLEHCKHLVPGVRSSDLTESYVGISHYLVDSRGGIQEESVIEYGPSSVHILRPKPGLTSSLTIGEHVAESVLERVR